MLLLHSGHLWATLVRHEDCLDGVRDGCRVRVSQLGEVDLLLRVIVRQLSRLDGSRSIVPSLSALLGCLLRLHWRGVIDWRLDLGSLRVVLLVGDYR